MCEGDGRSEHCQNIRDMQRWREAGCSYNKIAQQLNHDGIPTKTGKGKWQCGNVAGVLGSKHTGRILSESAGLEISNCDTL